MVPSRYLPTVGKRTERIPFITTIPEVCLRIEVRYLEGIVWELGIYQQNCLNSSIPQLFSLRKIHYRGDTVFMTIPQFLEGLALDN